MIQTRKLVWEIKPDILHAHYIFGYGTFAAFASYHPFIVFPWGSNMAVDPEKSLFHRLAITYTMMCFSPLMKKGDLIDCAYYE